jgi:hypothetical protein
LSYQNDLKIYKKINFFFFKKTKISLNHGEPFFAGADGHVLQATATLLLAQWKV